MTWNPDSQNEEGTPLGEWDWREIIRLERKAMARASRKPKCSVCRKALLLGQTGTHITCRSDEDS